MLSARCLFAVPHDVRRLSDVLEFIFRTLSGISRDQRVDEDILLTGGSRYHVVSESRMSSEETGDRTVDYSLKYGKRGTPFIRANIRRAVGVLLNEIP